ncbi:MAG: DUF2199 domain-containing protein [Rhodobacteraceae bacterium]|nr:DUF2199 domain-containing protein [Paracoccaceae bacterium]
MDRDLAHILSSRRKCRCCGATFAQLLSLEYDRPDLCPPDLPKLDNSTFLMERDDVLTEDFCRVGEYCFIRAVLILPLGDSEHEMVLGVWCAVSPVHFDTYLDLFDEAETGQMEPVPGWLANAIPPGTELPLACQLHMQPGDQRPEMELTEKGHELKLLQETGLDLTDLLGLLHAYGHDIGSLLHDA